jgi:hypothetical protein
VPLSEWALREAARQARQWQVAFGFTDSIAVNLPSRLFERSDLVEHIHQCVTQYGVPHRVIQLEITENNLMKDLQNVIPSLHRLNEIGVEISIDDFGTGYSSLAYLTTLPISELKIDRSFVRDLGITPQSSAVVTAIIALARSLGLRVVAEGVENAAPDGSAAPPGLHRDAGLPVQPGCACPTNCSAGWNRPYCRARHRGSDRPTTPNPWAPPPVPLEAGPRADRLGRRRADRPTVLPSWNRPWTPVARRIPIPLPWPRGRCADSPRLSLNPPRRTTHAPMRTNPGSRRDRHPPWHRLRRPFRMQRSRAQHGPAWWNAWHATWSVGGASGRPGGARRACDVCWMAAAAMRSAFSSGCSR